MRQLEKKELKEILLLHKKWLEVRKGGKKARFEDVCLSGLSLVEADLSKATFIDVDFRDCIIARTNFTDDYFQRCDFTDTDICNCSFENIKFHGAIMRHTYFVGCEFSGCDFEEASIKDIKFIQCKNVPFISQLEICPSGSFIGWKKLINGKIARLLIPAKAERSSATGRKCRCSYAKVLSIYDGKGRKCSAGVSSRGLDYTAGEYVYPDSFDKDRWDECSHGIHFFITRKEAEEYMLWP